MTVPAPVRPGIPMSRSAASRFPVVHPADGARWTGPEAKLYDSPEGSALACRLNTRGGTPGPASPPGGPADGAESGGGPSGPAATGIDRAQGTVNAGRAHHAGASRRGLPRRIDGGGPVPDGDTAAGRRRAGARPALRQPDRRSGRRLDRRGDRRGAVGRVPGGNDGRRATGPPFGGGRAGGCAGRGRRGRRRGPRPRRAVRARGRLPAVRQPAPHHRPGGVGGARRRRPLCYRRRRGARFVRPAGPCAARAVGLGDTGRRGPDPS